MGLILWIIFGGVAGWIASLIMNTDPEQGIALNIIIGIIGAAVGGFLMSLINSAPVTGFNLYGLFVAVLGSVALIWIVKLIRR